MKETVHPIHKSEEAAVQEVINAWIDAIKAKDIESVVARHSPDFWMFDVPGPFQVRGIEEYRATWDKFFRWSAIPVRFDVQEQKIVAGSDVAFVVATMKCQEARSKGGELDFRLTVGLRKVDGRWTIVHEHHSIPAE